MTVHRPRLSLIAALAGFALIAAACGELGTDTSSEPLDPVAASERLDELVDEIGWVDNQVDETQLRLWPSYDSPQAPARDAEELSFGFITCVNGTREDSAVDNFIVRVCDTKEP